MTKKNRADSNANCLDSQNQFDTTNIKSDLLANYGVKFANLQQDLTVLLTERPRKVVKCVPCHSCDKPYASFKMSKIPNVCRKCLESARTKPVRERRRFVDSALNNFHRFLRSAVAL